MFDVTRGGAAVTRLEPAKRIYDMPPQPTTEAGIHAAWRGDLYVVLGDTQTAGGYAVRIYFNPLVRFIWLGAADHVPRRRRLAVGSPLARRRPRARRAASPRHPPNDAMPRDSLARRSSSVAILPAARRWRCEPDEILSDPALEARARAHFRGPALPRLPEPVDRRQQRAAGARSAPSGARAADGRRQRRAGDALRRGPLRRVRAAAGRRSSWRTIVLWVSPLLALLVAMWMTARAWRRRQLPAADRDGRAAVAGRGREVALDPRRERGRAAGARLALARRSARQRRIDLPRHHLAFAGQRLQQRSRRQPRHRHARSAFEAFDRRPSIRARKRPSRGPA